MSNPEHKSIAPELSDELRQELLSQITSWESELHQCLPVLPEPINIDFNNDRIISFTGTGGVAVDKDRIELAFDPDFTGDKNEQMRSFKGLYFHESYHLAQGLFLNNDTWENQTMLEHAIYEGAATKFEMLCAGSSPGWAEYPEDEIKDWVQEIAALPEGILTNPDEYTRWKFYDKATDRQWVAYRSGCYIIDQALKYSPDLQIEDLATMPAQEILELSLIQVD